jgi:hypothetical protein
MKRRRRVRRALKEELPTVAIGARIDTVDADPCPRIDLGVLLQVGAK